MMASPDPASVARPAHMGTTQIEPAVQADAHAAPTPFHGIQAPATLEHSARDGDTLAAADPEFHRQLEATLAVLSDDVSATNVERMVFNEQWHTLILAPFLRLLASAALRGLFGAVLAPLLILVLVALAGAGAQAEAVDLAAIAGIGWGATFTASAWRRYYRRRGPHRLRGEEAVIQVIPDYEVWTVSDSPSAVTASAVLTRVEPHRLPLEFGVYVRRRVELARLPLGSTQDVAAFAERDALVRTRVAELTSSGRAELLERYHTHRLTWSSTGTVLDTLNTRPVPFIHPGSRRD